MSQVQPSDGRPNHAIRETVKQDAFSYVTRAAASANERLNPIKRQGAV